MSRTLDKIVQTAKLHSTSRGEKHAVSIIRQDSLKDYGTNLKFLTSASVHSIKNSKLLIPGTAKVVRLENEERGRRVGEHAQSIE